MRQKSFFLSWEFLICFGLVLITLAVFIQTAGFGFVGVDDYKYIVKNEHVSTGLNLQNVKWAFTSVGYGSNWYPLTWLSYMFDVQLFGVNPGWHHIVNFLFHTFNVLLLFLFLRLATGARWLSAITAVIFAIHPLRAESVAFIAERKDVLSAFFFFSTLILYLKYLKNPKLKNYLLILFSFILAALSKAMVVTLPFVLLLLDYWPLSRVKKNSFRDIAASYKKLVWEKLPLFVISAILAVITMIAAASGAAFSSESLPVAVRLNVAVVSYAKYIGRIFWPNNLSFPYPRLGYGIPDGYVVGSMLLLVAITVGAIVLRKRFSYLIVGWLWFLGALLPVIGLIGVGAESTPNRFTYIPQIGLTIMIVWGLAYLFQRLRAPKLAVIVLAGITIMFLTAAAVKQVSYWESPVVLFEHTVKANPKSSMAFSALCVAYAEQKRYGEALASCDQAINLLPNDPLVKDNKNKILDIINKSGGEIDSGSLRGQPIDGTATIRDNLKEAEIQYNKGLDLARNGGVAEAERYFSEAIELNPAYSEAYSDLGVVLLREGKQEEAIEHFSKAVELRSDNISALYHWGIALAETGLVDEAMIKFSEALKIQPDFAPALRAIERYKK